MQLKFPQPPSSPDAPDIRAENMLLSDLSPAERERVLRKLHAVPARSLSEGWQRWELEDILSAHARKLGVQLTADQKRAIISRV
jgi:hypothetical protein